MKYEIFRECWNEKTFNGYKDNPYWRININGLGYGLTDCGRLWSVHDIPITSEVKEQIRTVLKECRLSITI